MIETRIIEYLRAQNIEGIGTHVYAEVPKDKVSEYILVNKMGGGRENLIDQAIVAVQSRSSISLYRAAELNKAIKTAMDSFTAVRNVFSSDCNTDYNYTDTNTKEYRYQAVFDIHYKEER